MGSEGGDSQWITGEAARARAHELRDRYDAVLIGRGTLEKDDPSLDVRIPGDRRDPVAVVLDSRLQAPLGRKLWERARNGAQVIVAAVDPPSPERAKRLQDCGVEVLAIPSDDDREESSSSLLGHSRAARNELRSRRGRREGAHSACSHEASSSALTSSSRRNSWEAAAPVSWEIWEFEVLRRAFVWKRPPSKRSERTCW